MSKAHIKIIHSNNDKSDIVLDEKTEVIIKNNKYYFATAKFSQELLVEDKNLEIIKSEMTIKLTLGKVIESTYSYQKQELKMRFIMNKLQRNKDDLEFNYSLVDLDNKILNTIEVSINF